MRKPPIAASVLSLGLLLPLGTVVSGQAIAAVENAVAPIKHVTIVTGGTSQTVETRAGTVDDMLHERGITATLADRIEPAPATELHDGSTVTYVPAVSVNLVVDGAARSVASADPDVAALLRSEHVALGSHDRLAPAPSTPLREGLQVSVTRVTSWLEHRRATIAAPVRHTFDLALRPGTRRVIDPGRTGLTETTVEVLQPSAASAPTRTTLASRVLRLPRAKIVAEGLGNGVALSEIARRGFVGTMHMADSALRMVATAYTAHCGGCSGITATGRVAGHGVVAVDPRVIPLGSHLFIPGYGHAFAGDTGGAIKGSRIDLGFDSLGDAMRFGRRAVVVFVLK